MQLSPGLIATKSPVDILGGEKRVDILGGEKRVEEHFEAEKAT